MSFLNKIFGSATDYKKLKEDGALILDVRSKAEFMDGHIPGSVNIPLDNLEASLKKLPSYKGSIITCCRSGMRSSAAASLLNKKGIVAVNGGAWTSLIKKLQ